MNGEEPLSTEGRAPGANVREDTSQQERSDKRRESVPKQEKEKEGARGWGDRRRWSDSGGPERKNSRNRKRYDAVWAVGSGKGGPCTCAGVALATPLDPARRRSRQPGGRARTSAPEP